MQSRQALRTLTFRSPASDCVVRDTATRDAAATNRAYRELEERRFARGVISLMALSFLQYRFRSGARFESPNDRSQRPERATRAPVRWSAQFGVITTAFAQPAGY